MAVRASTFLEVRGWYEGVSLRSLLSRRDPVEISSASIKDEDREKEVSTTDRRERGEKEEEACDVPVSDSRYDAISSMYSGVRSSSVEVRIESIAKILR